MTKHIPITINTQADPLLLSPNPSQKYLNASLIGIDVIILCLCVNFYWPLITLIQQATDPTQRVDLIALSTIGFALVYILAGVSIGGLGLDDPDVQKIVASRCISTLHASIVVVSGIICMQRQLHHSSWFDIQKLRTNTPSEQRIFEFSAGFFIVDITVLLIKTQCRINKKESIMLLCHHLLSLYFMLASGWFGHDGAIGLMGLIIAESTSPFVSMWTIARALKSKRHLAWTSPLFTVTFSVMRLVAMTISLADGGPRWLFSPSSIVPYGVRVSACLSYSLLGIGGWIWANDAIRGLRGFYRKQKQLAMARSIQVQPILDDKPLPCTIQS